MLEEWSEFNFLLYTFFCIYFKVARLKLQLQILWSKNIYFNVFLKTISKLTFLSAL